MFLLKYTANTAQEETKMSKGGRLSRLFPKFFRGKDKSENKHDSFGPICLMSFLDDTEQRVSYKVKQKYWSVIVISSLSW